MKRYKVQWAYPLEVGSPSIHNNEASAAGEVGYLLGTWIWRNLQHYLAEGGEFEAPDHPEFFEGMKYLIPAIQQLIQQGRVWEAYDLWEDFYLRFENEFGRPLYAKIGTVIVEGSPETKLKNKIPFIERTNIPPMKRYAEKGKITVAINRREDKMGAVVEEVMDVVAMKAELKGIKITADQFFKAVVASEKSLEGKFPYQDEQSENEFLAAFREGILRRIFPKDKGSGMGLGAMKSWLVQYADLGGATHAGRHTNEERAKREAGEFLMILINHLGTHAGSENISGRNQKYVKDAAALIDRIHYLLSDEMVWRAYLEYKTFENRWHKHFSPFPLEMSIGTMRVIPKPEPEPE